MMYRILIIIIIMFSCCVRVSKASPENEDFFFKHLQVEDGLSQQTVTAIFQDSEQYMWFGTRNGLNRYDGYKFTEYRKNYDDEQSLANNYISTILEDQEKNLWVATNEGVNRIFYKTGQISRYCFGQKGEYENVNTIFNLSDGRLMAFTQTNSYLYDKERDSFCLLKLSGETVPENIISAIQTRNGNLYLGTQNLGLFIYDQQLNFIRWLPKKAGSLSTLDGYVSYLWEEREDRIWMILSEKNLCYYNPVNNKVEIITTVDNVRRIIDWSEKYLLLGTFHGLVLLDKQTLQPTIVDMKIGSQGGLSHYSILSLLKDINGNLWVGTYSGGVNYCNRYNYRFEYVEVKEFSGIITTGAEDQQGTIWFATEGGGLLAYNPRTHTQQNYWVHERKSGSYNRNIIKTLFLEGNSLYCATHGAEVYRFSLTDKKFYLLYDFGYNDICTLFRDSEGRLWIPTNTKWGLVVMDGEREVKNLNLKNRFPELGVVVSILEIEKRVFLLGTRADGVFIYDENTDRFMQLQGQDWGLGMNTSLEITSMLKDRRGDIWIATNGAGLFRFDGKMKLQQRYAKSNGLQDERVYGIVEHKEDIWLMTSREFYRLKEHAGPLKRFYSIDGVIPTEFTPGGMFTGQDGKLYLPGIRGFMIVDPDVMTENPVVPPVLFTGLKIDNEEVLPRLKGSPLKEKLNLQSRIELKHNQTNLTIGYTALNYLYPHQNQYAFRMVGLEEKWNYVGERREAYYSNLKPGKYVFRVKASNNDNVWNEEGAHLEIIVLPPLWFTWWAYAGYVLIVTFIIYSIVRARHRKHELERSLHLKQLEQEKLQELAEERTRFFTYVTHEFRTPLTLIINPINDLLRKYVHVSGVKESLILVRRNAERLLSLVNSLMDIEKQRVQKAELCPVSFDFAVFAQEMGAAFNTIAESRGIRFTTEVKPDYIPARYDKEKLEPIFFNILSNAFKFTREGGNVSLQVELLPAAAASKVSGGKFLKEDILQWIYICVKDDGIGIDPGKADQIFEPFYQGNKDIHGQMEGSGVGLSITRTIIHQQEGIIFVRLPEKGTEMCVLLPYSPATEESMRDSWMQQEEKREVANRKHSVLDTDLKVPVSDLKVLVVEDNAEALEYLRIQLAQEYTVLTAINGKEAWEIIEKEFPDMVVSDVMMPEMDGVELCTRIKKDFRLCHIPVILLTAKSMTQQIEEGFRAGADDYIPKPFSISLLKIRIHNLFANRDYMKKAFGKKLSLENLGFDTSEVNQDFMNRYVEIVKANFRNQSLDVETICGEMQMSRANFYKKLKSMTDLSPMELVRNIRLETAARLLKETKLTVSEIAVQVGFNSNSYFGSCFKALYGMSPKEYQNSKEK